MESTTKQRRAQTVLITGITGMAGSHLAEYLVNEHPDILVYGTKRWRSSLENVRHLGDNVSLIDCELTDSSACTRLISNTTPDIIFHLAAQSYVPDSWGNPQATLIHNSMMQLNLFEAIRTCGIDPIVHLALSSEEYGHVEESELPITEDNPLRPLSPYGVSKVTQDLLGYQYFKSYGLKVIRTRAFNHEGPRRGAVFVTSNFAKQIAEIELGLQEPIVFVGNLAAKRDWTDVRDMVRAYWLAVQKCIPGEVYVIASGQTFTIGELLDMLLEMSRCKVEVRIDPTRLRPSDVLVLQGNPAKFKSITGWEPRIPLRTTIGDILNYWRDRLRRGKESAVT